MIVLLLVDFDCEDGVYIHTTMYLSVLDLLRFDVSLQRRPRKHLLFFHHHDDAFTNFIRHM